MTHVALPAAAPPHTHSAGLIYHRCLDPDGGGGRERPLHHLALLAETSRTALLAMQTRCADRHEPVDIIDRIVTNHHNVNGRTLVYSVRALTVTV